MSAEDFLKQAEENLRQYASHPKTCGWCKDKAKTLAEGVSSLLELKKLGDQVISKEQGFEEAKQTVENLNEVKQEGHRQLGITQPSALKMQQQVNMPGQRVRQVLDNALKFRVIGRRR